VEGKTIERSEKMTHSPACNWEKANCEYKDTHHYCPHDGTNGTEDHKCNCNELMVNDPIFDVLNCYEIEASEVRNGMTYIDSSEATKLTILIQKALGKI
jgi:hypothetical protein